MTPEKLPNNSLICSENTKEGEPTLITVLLAKKFFKSNLGQFCCNHQLID